MSSLDEGLMFPKPKHKKRRKQHGKNVINTRAGECFLCALEGDHRVKPTERHHVIYGNGMREVSEAQGWVVYLCNEHHRNAPYAVHNCRATREKLCRIIQLKYEETHTREEWMAIVGKNYLEGEIFQKFKGMQRGDLVKYQDTHGHTEFGTLYGFSRNDHQMLAWVDPGNGAIKDVPYESIRKI